MLSVNSTQLTSAECACRSELCGVCEFSSRFENMRNMRCVDMYGGMKVMYWTFKVTYITWFLHEHEKQALRSAVIRYVLDRYCSI